MVKCTKCDDTGTIGTGQAAIKRPCDCEAGATALSDYDGVEGLVSGAEIRRHFMKGSPKRIKLGRKTFLASSLPGRPKK